MSEQISLGTSQEVPKTETSEKISEIAQAPVTAEWFTDIPDKQYSVILRLPYNCTLSATVFSEGARSAKVDMFAIPEEFHKQGIGTRLMQSLIAELKRFGIQMLTGHVTSESALRTRARIFGHENLRFYRRTMGGKGVKIEASFEQVLENIIAKKDDGYYVDADLSHVNSSEWVLPEQLG